MAKGGLRIKGSRIKEEVTLTLSVVDGAQPTPNDWAYIKHWMSLDTIGSHTNPDGSITYRVPDYDEAKYVLDLLEGRCNGRRCNYKSAMHVRMFLVQIDREGVGGGRIKK